MRLDIWLWLAACVVVMIAALLRLLRRADERPRRARTWASLVLTCLALALLAVGLAWRSPAAGIPLWPAGAWPGSTSSEGVALFAGGVLAITSWLLLMDIRRVEAAVPGPDRDRAAAEALALFGTALLVLVAVATAWNIPPPAPSPLARSWLFGLRVLAASLGLGAWLPACAAESRALGRNVAGMLRSRKETIEQEAIGATLGPEAMRAGYPWLTAACLLGAAWSLATAAALWRGLFPDAWLIAAWLLGGIYLIASWGDQPVRLPRWAMFLLTTCGTAAAVMQAWQTPLLLP
jgi:hypothetical protein